jgi:integrase
MPYVNTLQRRQVGQYLKWLKRNQGLSTRYISQVKSVLLHFTVHCYHQGVKQSNQVTTRQVLSFLELFQGYTIGHQRFVATALRRYLGHYGNACMLTLAIKLRGTSRQTVRWLSEDQCFQLLHEVIMTPLQRVLVLGSLLNGLRPIEIRRLSVKDVEQALSSGRIVVRAKGKTREIALQQDFARALAEYLEMKEPASEDSSLLGIERTKADTELRKVSEAAGFQVRGYDLRRSWGQRMFERSVPIEVIAEIYGHEDPRVTMKYIGVTTDHQKKALACYGVTRSSTSQGTLAQ